MNADNVISGANGAIEGYNLFSYRFNNPINLSDETGNWPSWKKIGSFLAGAAVAAIGIAAVIVAAPIVTAAASVGFIAGTVYAVGVVTCGFTAALCGGSIMGEAVTGNNPIKNSVGQGNFDLMTAASTMGSLQGLSQIKSSNTPTKSKSNTPLKTNVTPKPNITTPGLPKNGIKVSSSDALDMASNYLGKGYTEASPSRFVSADGFRQVRMTNSDLLGKHGGGPHVNFDMIGPGKYKSVHIYIFD